jgi:hypothetical protein
LLLQITVTIINHYIASTTCRSIIASTREDNTAP